MKKDGKEVRTKGGSVVYRHQARGGDATAAAVDEAWGEAIDAHIARHVAPAEHVFHEIVSERVHIDVHVVSPGDSHPYWLLYTTGMSARPMTVPDGYDATPYAELSIMLPPSWQCNAESFKDERWYWPIRWLKQLARLPHEYATWLGPCHTIPNGEPPRPFADGTKLCGMLVLRSITLPVEFQTVSLGDVEVDLFTLWPLTADEMKFKLDRGADALIDKFEAADLSDIIDPARPSVLRRRSNR